MNTSTDTQDKPRLQPAWGDRLRPRKALIPTLAVVAVTVAALATTLAAVARPAVSTYQPAVQTAQPRPPVCHNCGVVESAVAVQRQGQPKGIAGTQVTPGMAIGGVVGGLLGNQIGHGNGRAATTVLGAAGGAYAGHAIEKKTTKYTVYQMRIRMNDGTVRTVEQRNPVTVGSRVVLDHGAIRLARAGSPQG